MKRLYPSFNFWGSFLERQKHISGDVSSFTLADVNNLKLNFQVYDNLTIECGDIDGVVTDSWANVAGGSPEVCEDNPQAEYWACAAIWSDAWDQRTVDRVSYCFSVYQLLVFKNLKLHSSVKEGQDYTNYQQYYGKYILFSN